MQNKRLGQDESTHQVQDLACLDRSDRIMDRYDSHQVVAIGKRSACIIMTTVM